MPPRPWPRWGAPRRSAASCAGRRSAAAGTPVALLVRSAAGAEGLDDPDGDMPPLARASAIVCLLETAGGTLRVHPQDEASYFHVLLDDDRRWVVESGADAIVPVPGAGAELLGVVVAGRRLDGRLARPVDVPFLEGLGAAAGLALGRVLLTRMEEAASPDAPPAEECPACGCVTEAVRGHPGRRLRIAKNQHRARSARRDTREIDASGRLVRHLHRRRVSGSNPPQSTRNRV